jgi:membrane protease subunit HflC
MKIGIVVVAVLLIGALMIGSGCFYTLPETEQAIITEFGKPVGDPVLDAGLHWKTPFVQDVRRFEKRVLRWDGEPREISTREKKFVFIDTMGRWRISDPLAFLRAVGNVENAQQRLDNIIDGVVKDTISSTALIDVVRATTRPMKTDTDNASATPDQAAPSGIEEAATVVTIGRPQLMQRITAEAAKRLTSLGIELLDVRIKRLNFVDRVLEDVYRRMISERQRIAERFRSEGQGERARILGQLEKEQKRISSEAYRDAEKTRGDADATAARTYAEAYSRDAAFYSFVKSLDTLETSVADGRTNAVLSTKGELLELLQGAGATPPPRQ